MEHYFWSVINLLLLKNIFLFISHYFILICFVILQIVCIVLLSNSSKTHQAFFAAYANEVTGKVDHQYNNWVEYFSLKKVNKQLADENARLRNLIATDLLTADTSKKISIDSTLKDTLNRVRKYTYLPAKVVGNSLYLKANYLQLERGSLQGVIKGMSVVSPQGIVGVVVEVSDNYSKVMSLLHSNTRVSAMMQKSKSSGDIEWDGTDPHFVTMKKVSKSAAVAKGDTIVTSAYSANFPSNILVGTVVDIKPDPSSSFNNIKVKVATDFFSLQYVYLVENIRYVEQTTLANKKDNKE